MRLATPALSSLQEAFGTLLLQPEGLNALEDDASWQAYLQRSPHKEILADYPRDRLALYHELIYNTFEGSMEAFFPFTKRFLGDAWGSLVEAYRRAYPNDSFYLHPCAQAFPDFLSQQADLIDRYPFLVDLARYEQIDVEVYNEADFPLPETFQPGIPEAVEHLAAWAPVWNPVMTLQTFKYPIPTLVEALQDVEEDAEDFDPEQFKLSEVSTSVLIYRDPETHESRFFNLTPLTAKVLEAVGRRGSYQSLFQYLHREEPMLKELSEAVLLQEGLKLLHQCFAQKILLGSFPSS